MADNRQSGRLKDANARRILDEAARRRRQRRALEALEQDNFQDDPHSDLKMSKKAPKFDETNEQSGRRKKKAKLEFKLRVKKNLQVLLEEEMGYSQDREATYLSAGVPASKFPDRHFCAVCGFPSNYTCVQCGTRYCCVRCLGTHQDTRCLKWTA